MLYIGNSSFKSPGSNSNKIGVISIEQLRDIRA